MGGSDEVNELRNGRGKESGRGRGREVCIA